ncbi:MAG: GDP-mannose 4,6-dehydratase, partial [candidate division Zixibacteria bacterium]|nr:GDP-mannose 4,6-dehydratase [candidate division Zixibacteria bacterium]
YFVNGSASCLALEPPGRNSFRPSEIPVLRGDFSKAKRELGWKPSIKLEKTLSDTLDFWRSRNQNIENGV